MAGIDVQLPAVRGLVVQEMSQVLWVLESHVFPETHGPIREAILCLGHEFVDWDANWWSEGGLRLIMTSGSSFEDHSATRH